MEKIKLEIKLKGKTIKDLREQGLFFETIAYVLDIDRKDIKELEE